VDRELRECVAGAGGLEPKHALFYASRLTDEKRIVGDPSYPCNRQLLASFGATVNLIPTTAATR
jgi:hypothetical protein